MSGVTFESKDFYYICVSSIPVGNNSLTQGVF
jgi:hypothetical protein